MTSLIGWTIYLGHQGVVKHRREKQRVKNYERWEGLRDEYDDQKRVQRETRSLDIQRTGMMGVEGYTNGYGYEAEDKGVITLRDQQEANDARMGWRPQESWETEEERALREQKTGYGPMTVHGRLEVGREGRRSVDVDRAYVQRPVEHRAVSMTSGYDQMAQREQGMAPAPAAAKRLSAQKTGAVWDEALPPRLAVTRRNWDEPSGQGNGNGNGSQRASLQPSPQPSDQGDASKAASFESLPKVDEKGRVELEAEVVESHVPGGFMATLIEGRESQGQGPAQRSVQPVQRSNNPFEHQQSVPVRSPTGIFTPPPSNGLKSNNPFENMESVGSGNGVQTPVGEKDMVEWWK